MSTPAASPATLPPMVAQPGTSPPVSHPVRVVVVGGGFAGAYAAQALERRLRGIDAEITLIDRQNYFVFSPLLVEAGTGNLEPRHAVVSLRSFLKRARFRMAEVVDIDAERRTVLHRASPTAPVKETPYDHLVLAAGSVTRLPPVPGLAAHGYGMKSMADAVLLRDRAIRMLEEAEVAETEEDRAAAVHFVVVGGNFTGVEVAGEFDEFLKHAARGYRSVRPRHCKVTLVELTDRILGVMDPDLSEYALTQLRKRGVEVRLGASVREIRDGEVELENGEVLRTSTLVWCAGIAPSPLLATLPFDKDRLGYLLCEPDLRVRGTDRVWGIGDCAVNPGPDGKPYPATAQHAVQQAKDVAKNIRRALDGRPTEPHVFTPLGSLAALGCRTGVAKVFGVKLSGFWAWFLWRTVYLVRMPGWRRRVRVALDWTMDLVFRREYVSLGVHRDA